MTHTPSSGAARRIVALVLIPALMLLLGVVGIVCIDQGRSAAGTVAAMADQSQRLGEAATAAQSARHLAANGQVAEAGKALDGAGAAIRAAAKAEDSPGRRTKIEALLPVSDALRCALADPVRREVAGEALSDGLAGLGHLAGQDLMEAEAEVPAEILQTAALFGVLVLILTSAVTFAAFVAMRPGPTPPRG